MIPERTNPSPSRAIAPLRRDGAIGGEKIRARYPEYAAKLGEDGLVDIQAIVDAYEYLYQQPRRGWTFEVDVRTTIEAW